MTEPTRTLAAALAALQAEVPVIDKGRTATVTSQKGSYKYAFADLSDVARILQPLLAEHGFSFTSRPTLDDQGRFVLAYSLLHVSGESIDGAYPLPPNAAPQLVGSVITYARRYALCAVTGAVATEDDDGQAASTVDRPAARPRNASRRRESGPDEGPRPMSDPQRRKLMALYGKAGITDRDGRLGFAAAVLGRELSTSNEMSFDDCGAVIVALENAATDNHQGAPDAV